MHKGFSIEMLTFITLTERDLLSVHQLKGDYTYIQGTYTCPSYNSNHFSYGHLSYNSKSTYRCVCMGMHPHNFSSGQGILLCMSIT